MITYCKLFKKEHQIYGNIIKVLWGTLFVCIILSLIIVSFTVQKLFRDGHTFSEQVDSKELTLKWPGVQVEPLKQRFRHYTAVKRNNAIHVKDDPIEAMKKRERVGTKLANVAIGKPDKPRKMAKNKLEVKKENIPIENQQIDTAVHQEYPVPMQLSSRSESFVKKPWPYNRDAMKNNLNRRSVNEGRQYLGDDPEIKKELVNHKKVELNVRNEDVKRNKSERKVLEKKTTNRNNKADSNFKEFHLRKHYPLLNEANAIQQVNPVSGSGKRVKHFAEGVEEFKELSRYRTESDMNSKGYDKWMQYFAKKFEKYGNFHEEEFEPLSGREVEGGFSMVRFYRELATNRKVAIKRIVRGEDIHTFFRSLDLVIKEVEIMDKIYKHEVPFVSELYKILKDENNNVYMIMKYIGGKDLTDLLNEMRRLGIRRYSYEFAAGVVARVALALVGLHKINIAYKDLKYENIVTEYTRQEDPDTGELSYYLRNARLIDYGLSEILTKENNFECETVNGTPTTLAPEVYNGGWHGTAADIWSLGVVLYMMLTGEESPFDHECSRMNCEVNAHHPTEIIRDQVLFKEISFLADIFTPDAENLLRGMMERDPKKRFTAEQVIHHEWLKNNGISIKELFEQEKRLIQSERRLKVNAIRNETFYP